MRIESGTTGERRTRMAIFFLMCLGFTGWFAYDGWKRYPAENLQWALQAMPEKPAQPRFDPAVTLARLSQLEKRLNAGERISAAELKSQLGAPVYEQPRELVFAGSDFSLITKVADGKVLTATTQPVSSTDKGALPNYRLQKETVSNIKAGMTEQELTAALSQPTRTQEKTLWFVGPGAYAKFQIDGERVLPKPVVSPATDRTESDIFTQKLLAGGLLVLTLFVGLKLLKILRTHVVLDESGLSFNGRQISFDQMTALHSSEYAEKGWVDLEYQRNGDRNWLRLDNYHIDRFTDIVAALCERKGFASPTKPHGADASAAEG